MGVYLVERYLPRLTPADLRVQIGRERQLAGLRHLRTTYLPADELCFSLFEAPSLAAVTQANDLTGMAYERVSEAVELPDEEPAIGADGPVIPT